MTIQMYTNRKKLNLDEVSVRLRHSREHATDCEGCDETSQHIEKIERDISFKGDLSDAEIEKLIRIADRRAGDRQESSRWYRR